MFTSSKYDHDEHSGTILEQVESLKFKISIQSYSNIDQMSTFEVDVGQKKVTPDQYVENEVHFCLHGERRKENLQMTRIKITMIPTKEMPMMILRMKMRMKFLLPMI